MLPNNNVIADFLSQVSDNALPDDVVDMARRSLLDWFAVSFSAMAEPEAVAVSRYVSGWGNRGGAVSLFGLYGAAAPVALVNATMAHLLDFDDLHFGAALRAGAPTWAATLALGMARGVGSRRVLQAFVAGFEVAAAFGINGTGLALAKRGWHPTAVLAHLSSAVAAGVVLSLDRVQFGSAIGTSAAQAGGLIAAGGTVSKPLRVGKASMAGVMAAEMAEVGVDGSAALIEPDQLGLFSAMIGHDISLGDFAGTWNILGTSFQPYASCGFTHATIEAAQALSYAVPVTQAARVRVFGNPFALQVAGHLRPRCGSEARFSLSYAAALGLLGCDATPTEFGAEHLHRPDIASVLEWIEVLTDPAIERWSSRVELTLCDGRTLSETVLVPRGMGERALAWPDLEAKFLSTASRWLGRQTPRLLAAIRTFGDGGELELIRDMLEASGGAGLTQQGLRHQPQVSGSEVHHGSKLGG